MCRTCWAVSVVCRRCFPFWKLWRRKNAPVCCPRWRTLSVLLSLSLMWTDGKSYLPARTQVIAFPAANRRIGLLNFLNLFGNEDWKLEQNPVSGFLSLLRNVLHRHRRNTEQLLEGSNIAIIGSLMQKVTTF